MGEREINFDRERGPAVAVGSIPWFFARRVKTLTSSKASGKLDRESRLGNGGLDVRYAIIIERAEGNYSAYAPDLPGCVATGQTVAEVTREMHEAIQFHLDSMREDGQAIPVPTILCDSIETENSVAN